MEQWEGKVRGTWQTALEKIIPAVTSLKYGFRRTRIGTGLRNILRLFSSNADSRKEINLMREVSAENHVPLHSEDAQRVFAIFKDNLSYILEFFSQRQIPVIVSDVTSNLDFPPFAYKRLVDAASLALINNSI